MARFRGRMSAIRPVQRIKHVIDASGTANATQNTVPLILASDTPDLAGVTEVQTGAIVNGIYLHVEVSHTANTGRPNIYMMVVKNPGGNLTMPQADSVGNSDNKRFVIHQEMLLMSGDAGSGLPRPIFNGVIVIPKGYRRFGPNDQLNLHIVVADADITADWCMQCHYKEFR